MIKRTLFFTKAACLTLKDKQLCHVDKETQTKTTIPIEDIGFVVIDNSQILITIPLITELTRNNAAVIFCNEKHMPYSMNLPLEGNIIQDQLFSLQINADEPLKKNIWKQLIKSKIQNQGKVLQKQGIDSSRFTKMSGEVKSGDPNNLEGQAAKLYWDLLVGVDWLRGRFGEYPNSHFNYGYSILRAATARALVGSGLLPTFGIHHHNKYNAYALADDIMEPYRPFVDDEVINYTKQFPQEQEITTNFKKTIMNLLIRDVEINKVTRPLSIALTYTTASLSKVFSGKSKKIELPVFIS